MSTRPAITISDYNADWPRQFEQLRAVYAHHLAGLAVDIRHVGSTAVPGLAAKPILDIDLIVPEQEIVPRVIERLAELGYDHLGDLGIVGREAFRRQSSAVPFHAEISTWPLHNLYVGVRGAVSIENHLRLRDYLRTHPAAVAEYAALKRDLARTYTHDIDAYIEGKTAFISPILAICGLAQTDLADIANQNKKKPVPPAARAYHITTTLGPSSEQAAVWAKLLAAGATAFRLNTSHLSLSQLTQWLAHLSDFFDARRERIPLVLDLQGSKWRLGDFPACTLAADQTVQLIHAPQTEQANVLPIPHADFFKAVATSSAELVLNDAKNRLRITDIASDRLTAQVVQGGPIASCKGITFTDTAYRLEQLSEKDQAIIRQTRSFEPVRYAISYVRDAGEMSQYRQWVGAEAYLIAKLERQPAVEQAEEIAAYADELWLCRGDLGAELGLVEMARVVHDFTAELSRLDVPVVLAGQLLEHMTEHATPTRSEVCYLYDVVRSGYDGIVLSDETAIGRYPVESCQTAAMFWE